MPQGDADTAAAAGGVPAGMDKRLKSVEERLQQVLQAREDDRASRHVFRLLIGSLVAAALIVWIGLSLIDRVWGWDEAPESLQMIQVPVDVEGEPVMLGVQMKSWKIPPNLQAAFLRQQRTQFEEELEQYRRLLRNQYDDELKRNIREKEKELERKTQGELTRAVREIQRQAEAKLAAALKSV